MIEPMVAVTAYGTVDHATVDGLKTLCGREVFTALNIPFRSLSAWSCFNCGEKLRNLDKAK